MDLLLLAFVAFAILLLIILVIALVERVNKIERDTLEAIRMIGSTNRAPGQGQFAGLAGQQLWDALAGSGQQDLQPEALDELRGRYEAVLTKHIESLFNEGVMDGRLGVLGTPRNSKQIAVTGGAVESWLPEDLAKQVYDSGIELARSPGGQRFKPRQMLDEVCANIFASVRIAAQDTLADRLIPADPVAATRKPPPATVV